MDTSHYDLEWAKTLKEQIDKLVGDLHIGPVGNDLYQIGEGCFTGKDGYEEFLNKLNDELY